MPKIAAPTVAEHHRQRRAELLAAARDLLAADGIEGVTLAAVGARAGLARSSVYQYFDSAPALLAAVIEDAFPRATAELAASVASVQAPAEQVEAYVATALRLAGDADHRALAALAGAGIPAQCRSRIGDLHEQQQAPLLDALTRLDVARPDLAARLVSGLINAAARGSTQAEADEARAAVTAILRSGLAGLARANET